MGFPCLIAGTRRTVGVVELSATVAGQLSLPPSFLVMVKPIVAQGSSAFGLTAGLTSLDSGSGAGWSGLAPAMISGRCNAAAFLCAARATSCFLSCGRAGGSCCLRPSAPTMTVRRICRFGLCGLRLRWLRVFGRLGITRSG